MSGRWALLFLVLLVGGAALLWVCLRPAALPPGIVLAGGDGGGLPRAEARAEGFDDAALAVARQYAEAEGTRALLIARHGHLVSEFYGHGLAPADLLDGGGFGDGLIGLAAGVAASQGLLAAGALQPFEPARLAAQISAAAHLPYVQFLSEQLWRPLNAAAALMAVPPGQAPAVGACCVYARAVDWLRIALVLLDDGRFEGTQVLGAGWAARLAGAEPGAERSPGGWWLAAAAHGAEPFASDGVMFLRGADRSRLWLVPGANLAILWLAQPRAQAGRLDETRLPNLVIRALRAPQSDPHAGLGLALPIR